QAIAARHLRHPLDRRGIRQAGTTKPLPRAASNMFELPCMSLPNKPPLFIERGHDNPTGVSAATAIRSDEFRVVSTVLPLLLPGSLSTMNRKFTREGGLHARWCAQGNQGGRISRRHAAGRG